MQVLGRSTRGEMLAAEGIDTSVGGKQWLLLYPGATQCVAFPPSAWAWGMAMQCIARTFWQGGKSGQSENSKPCMKNDHFRYSFRCGAKCMESGHFVQIKMTTFLLLGGWIVHIFSVPFYPFLFFTFLFFECISFFFLLHFCSSAVMNCLVCCQRKVRTHLLRKLVECGTNVLEFGMCACAVAAANADSHGALDRADP